MVVGSGVVGLTCAVRLLEAGHRVDVLARDRPLETTSSVAAALWYPYRALPVERVTGWAARSFEVFRALAKQPETGVAMVAGTELFRAKQPDPWWASAGPVLERVSPDPPYVDGWSFVAPVVEMPVYLRWLGRRLEDGGGTLTRMALSGLPTGAHAAQGDVVVNAAGLGARLLAADPTLQPVRGQVVHVSQIGLTRWWLDSSGPDGGPPVYVVPRSHDIVVGGTDEEGSWDRRPDPRAASAILARASRFVPALAEARPLGSRVGLRPVRPTVRLELERPAGTEAAVVHCYGHGGAGVTLSWGCAEEVAELVAKA